MPMKIRDYYLTPDVRSRMIEFLGGHSLEEATCHYIGRAWDTIKPGFNMRKPGELDAFLENEWDVARSLWDKQWLVADLDVEYANFDFPAEPFLDYQRTFALQEPVLHALQRIFTSVGMHPLHAVSGRGHHFGWKVRLTSPAFQRLAGIGVVTPALAGMYAHAHPPEGQPVDPQLGKAFAGVGLVLEYVAHQVLAEAQPLCPIPVLPEAVDMGPQQRGKEIISVDISEYGDPLHTRGVRIPFSIYLKPWQHADILRPEIEGRVPVMVMVPSNGLDTDRVTSIMRDVGQAAEWASQAHGVIPDCSHGIEGLIELYLRSELRSFHEWFYSAEHEPPERWPSTYDRTPLGELPPMVRYALERPNDILLKPAFLRQVVGVLLDRGWHPRHIAGLIRSKYERDFGWLNQWYVYDASTRADFHTRVYAGLIAMGRDRVVEHHARA